MHFSNRVEETIAAVILGSIGVGIFIAVVTYIGNRPKTPAYQTPSLKPAQQTYTCTFNGITSTSVRTCDEMASFYKTSCPNLVSAGDPDLDCSDFKSQEYAQSMYDLSVICMGYDYHHLDRDKDGKACEVWPTEEQ